MLCHSDVKFCVCFLRSCLPQKRREAVRLVLPEDVGRSLIRTSVLQPAAMNGRRSLFASNREQKIGFLPGPALRSFTEQIFAGLYLEGTPSDEPAWGVHMPVWPWFQIRIGASTTDPVRRTEGRTGKVGGDQAAFWAKAKPFLRGTRPQEGAALPPVTRPGRLRAFPASPALGASSKRILCGAASPTELCTGSPHRLGWPKRRSRPQPWEHGVGGRFAGRAGGEEAGGAGVVAARGLLGRQRVSGFLGPCGCDRKRLLRSTLRCPQESLRLAQPEAAPARHMRDTGLLPSPSFPDGFWKRQTQETEGGRVEQTGSVPRRAPGGVGNGHADPGWPVAVSESNRNVTKSAGMRGE